MGNEPVPHDRRWFQLLAESREDDLEEVRREIIRLSARLPWDDPLRVAIACSPRGGLGAGA